MSRQQIQYINVEVVLSTLATLTAITGATAIDAGRLQGVRLKKMKLACSYKGKTAGEGPLVVGLCDTTLSVAEIAEAILADPQGVAEVPATEQGNRRVFPIWNIGPGLVADDAIQMYREVHFPWKDWPEDKGIKVFVFNNDGSNLTTGTTVTVFGPVVQEWLRD